ncbi:galactokinase family protein [Nesterenkonia sp. CL21]|uniref:galactokinase n=1 Tax=Nesterenkonia sp. CL21 TaxID=3064894 RepID=UPI0028789FCF|nr:galactokinase family protein [Nesterenkonia sp. CL21]MDS2172679.1 galactokinase family protein [Nesterenkonia sp. CL21]
MHSDDAARLSPGEPHRISAGLRTRFAEEFGRDPDGVWFAPGRANLNGEHVDFHGGRCLPMALAHGTYVAAAPRQDGLLRLRTMDPELDAGVQTLSIAAVDAVVGGDAGGADDGEAPVITDVHTLVPGQVSGWTWYVAGTLWALARLGEDIPELTVPGGFGADLLICSTLPIGGGLSSSAALECSAMLAFVALATPLGAANPGTALDAALDDELRAHLAAACMRAEVEVVGAGTGGLDQTVSLRGRAGHVVSLDCRDFTVARLPADGLLAEHAFLAIDTRQAHWLGDGQFDDRRADSEAAMRMLGVDRLRDLLPERPEAGDVDAALARFDELAGGAGLAGDAEALEGRSTAACRRRLRHALTEMLRSEQLDRILTGDGLEPTTAAVEVGRILTAGHASMRDDAEVSFPAADALVETATGAGALGARLIGGGFGGSVLALVPRDREDAVIGAAARVCEEQGFTAPRFLHVEPSAPARVVG